MRPTTTTPRPTGPVPGTSDFFAMGRLFEDDDPDPDFGEGELGC